ncbi:MAG: esterase/lipase family protein [Vulcanimicrobiota bacterium]
MRITHSAARKPQIPSVFKPYLVDPPAPVPQLQRPVLIVPGGRSQRVGLPALVNFLTEGSPNQYAGHYNVEQKDKFEETYREHGGNVFTLQYTHKFGSVERNAGEIKQAIEDIRRVTGADEIDVVAECKGSVEERQYLHDVEEGQDGIRNLVQLVPPNHGIPAVGDVTNLWVRLIEGLKLPVKSFHGVALDSEASEAYKSFGGDWKVGPLEGNPRIRQFNSPESVAKEKRAYHSLTVVGGDGHNQLKMMGMPGLPLPWLQGDNELPRSAAYLEHADNNFFYNGENGEHAKVQFHPKALAKIAETLVTDGNPSRDEHYVGEQPSMTDIRIRTGLYGVSLAGRLGAAGFAVAGAPMGLAGNALAMVGLGLTAVDAGWQVNRILKGEEEVVKGSIGVLAKAAQVAGVGLALTGTGWPAAVLIGGGLAASAWAWHN